MTKEKKPGVLVVLATLGQRPDLLRQTLTSIASQNIKNLDIAIIYPFKDTATTKIADEFGAKKIDDPGSMCAAVNKGVKSATSKHKYITWIGDDDLLAPGSLEKTIKALEDDNDAVAAFGYCEYIDDSGEQLFISKAGSLAPWLMTWGPNLVPLPGSLFRASALLDMDQPFDQSLKYAMDLDLFLRLRKIGKLVNTRTVVSSFRWHASSTTVANRDKSLDEAQRVKRRYMSPVQRSFAFLWEKPVYIATKIAANRVNSLARRQSKSA